MQLRLELLQLFFRSIFVAGGKQHVGLRNLTFYDFNTSEGPATVRGETFTGGENKTIDNFGTLTYSDTIIVDIKFTSTAGTHINFSVGNKAEDWSHYFGYYKLTSAGVIEGNSDGITITNTPDGYYRMTIVLRELTKASDGVDGNS